jgi:ribosomal protein S18 acetylase RimI-like enzyme
MKIRIARKEDTKLILEYDKHIAESELDLSISLGRVIVAEYDNKFIGWLRWNLFWDNTPFMNMLYLIEGYRNKGYGKKLVFFWEKLMKENNYKLVMTSTLSNENAQHFYRKMNYIDSGSLSLKGEALEIIFTKEL